MPLLDTQKREIISRFLAVYDDLLKREYVRDNRDFARALKMPEGYLSYFTNEARPVPMKYVKMLRDVFNVSEDWVKDNKGQMYGPGGPQKNFQSNSNRAILPLNEAAFVDLPYLPIPARATFVEMAADPNSYGQMETFRVYNPAREIEGKKAFVIEIDGDSMEPQLKSGDKVLAVEIPKGDWVYQTGKIYAIAFGNSFVVKRITNNDLMLNNRLTLSSDNPMGGEITIKGNELIGMWKVLRGIDTAII